MAGCWLAGCSAFWLADWLLAGELASRLLASYLAVWLAGCLPGSLAGWLLAGWVAAWLAGWQAAGWLAGWPADKSDPLPENLRQMEISIALSHGAHTQPKSNFNTRRILSMWHIFILTWFYQRETCSKRSKFQKVAVPFGRGLPMHQYVEPAVNRQPGFRRELVEQNQHLHSIIDSVSWGYIALLISK